MTGRFITSVVLFVAALSYPVMSSAQVIELVTAGAGVTSAALAGKAAKDIIADARLMASGLLAEANRTGNALIVRAADELNVSADNAIRLIDANLDKKFETLKEMERELLLGVAKATVAAKVIGERAYTAKDTLSLDVRSILGGLPLTTEVFVLQRVSGLTQLEKAGPYALQLIGSYVGLPASGYKTAISLAVSGKRIENLRIDPKEVHVTTLSIPSAQLKPFFRNDAVVIAEAELIVDYARPGWVLWIVPRAKKDRIATKLHLVLYPPLASEVDVFAGKVEFGWKDISADTKEETGPGAHCSSKCKGHFGIPHDFAIAVAGGERIPQLPGDVRITAATCAPIPGHNGFDADIGASVLDSGRRGNCHFRARSHASRYRLTVQRQQWAQIGDNVVKSKAKLFHDQITEIRVPKGSNIVRMSGRTLTGERFDYLVGESDAANPVRLVRRVENAADVSLFVRAQRPAGLD